MDGSCDRADLSSQAHFGSTYGRLATITLGAGIWPDLTFSNRCDIMVCIGAPWILAFFWVIFRAFSDMSVAYTSASGNSFLTVMAIQPEPVPTSSMIGCGGSTLWLGLTPGR